MDTYRRLFTPLALCALCMVLGTAIARADTPPTPPKPEAKPEIVPSLFVQSAEKVSFKDGVLSLHRVSPTTIIFADRPVRAAGHMPTKEAVQEWSKQGPNSFAADPPNASLSTYRETGDPQVVVVELKNPRLQADTLSYDVKVIQGTMPKSGGVSSLFIDIIGMPLTPLSYAGVARRSARRAAFYGFY